MCHFKIYGIFTLLLALTGCVSLSEVGKIDRDTYSVGATTHAGAVSDSDLYVKAATKATEFCAKKNLDMQRVHTLLDGTRAFGSREVIFNFRCVKR